MSEHATARLWIGAPSPGGLALPSAHPTSSALYGPRGVYLDDSVLIIADTGNHRVLIWHGLPDHDHAAADIVLGQPDFVTEGPNARGAGPSRGLNMPTGIATVDGNLVVADAWNHRILVWDGIPDTSYTAPEYVLGQPDLESIDCNAGRAIDGATMNWPFGFLIEDGQWLVMDTGNRRVLGWHSTPYDSRPADFILGQPDGHHAEENRGGPCTASSFRWPHAAVRFDESLWIADPGNHRILGWPAKTHHDAAADRVLGQKDFTSNQEFVMAPQSGQTLRFPYGIAANRDWIATADTSNNRILGWSRRAIQQSLPADWVLGQPDFKSNGENHWKAVNHNTLCWPYGLAFHNDRLAIADSGNNRVIIWQVPDPTVEEHKITEAEPVCA